MIMLTLGQALIGKNVLSLRNGTPVGRITGIVIDPNNLKIEGWYAQDNYSRKNLVLLTQEIRDVLPQGFVVNDHEALTAPEDLVRLKKILQINFTLTDKPVVSNHKRRLGKVVDYAFEQDGFFIQKLYVAQSVLKSFSGGTLMIDRNQIVEITDRRIVVKEATVAEAERSPIPAVAPAQ